MMTQMDLQPGVTGDQLTERLAASPLAELTDIELQIVDLVSQGQSTQDNADTLDIGFKQAARYRSDILSKSVAFSMAQVVRLSCDSELFTEPLELPAGLQRPTASQLEAFDIFSYGLSERYVARQLDILPRTARMRRTRAIHSLGAASFPHAIRLAWQAGFVPTQPS